MIRENSQVQRTYWWLLVGRGVEKEGDMIED